MTATAILRESIRASAGSGKTYALTGRYLQLVMRGVDPRRILATTFTRKAAGEILERVLERLSEVVLHPDRLPGLAEQIGDPNSRSSRSSKRSSGWCATCIRCGSARSMPTSRKWPAASRSS